MNIYMYDLTQKNLSLPDSYGSSLGKQRLLRMRIFRVFTVLFALLTVALIFVTAGWRGNSTARMINCVLLYLSVMASMGLLFFARTRSEIRRLQRESFQDCHDYDYVLYRTLYKNNRTLRAVLLLSMSKYQLLLQHPEQASQALGQLSPEKLNKVQLKTYYLYRAAAAFLMEDPSWRDALDACHLVPVEKAAVSTRELEEAFIGYTRSNTPDDNSEYSNTVRESLSDSALQKYDNRLNAPGNNTRSSERPEAAAMVSAIPGFDGWENSPLWKVLRSWNKVPQPKAPVLITFTGILLLYTGCFGAIAGLLPDGVSYRPLFETASTSLLFLLWFALSVYWVYRLFGVLHRQSSFPAVSKILLGIALICLEGMFLLYGAGCMLMVFLQAPTEESVTADGLIYMREDTFMDGSIYYYQKAVGPLFCRRLTEEERDKYHIDADENKITDGNASDANGNNGSIGTSESDSKHPGNNGTTSGKGSSSTDAPGSAASSDDTASDTALLSEFQAVYMLLADEGQLPADGADALSISYTAKGTPYVIFQETATGTETIQNRLVYDRVSKNGVCDLFVYYQDTTPSDGETQTAILEFYAVNPQTLTVTPGDKHAWADVPSEAYREATGE